MRRALLALVALTVLVSCDDRSSLTAPGSPQPGPASFGISDGAHRGDGINLGNEDFFFLPPVVKTPAVATYKDRPFHATIRPRATICLLKEDASGCETTIEDFAPDEITVSPVDELYQVNWDTKAFGLLTGRVYRIEVFVQQTLLGYADVDPVSNGAEMRNVNTNDFIALVDGRTLPIKFRVERGATCEFKPCTEVIVDREAGGTFHAADNGAAIQIPANAMPVDNVLLTIERKPVLPSELCISDPTTTGFVWRQWEGCYVIKTDPDLDDTTPRGFQEDVVVGVCIEPGVPEELEHYLELLKHDDGVGIQRGQSVAAPFLNCTGFTGTPSPIGGLFDRARHTLLAMANRAFHMVEPRAAQAVDGGLGTVIIRGGTLSTFFWGLPISATIQAGDEQVAPIGAAVAIAPAVLIQTAHAHPEHPAVTVDGAPVRFRITAGGGKLVSATGAELDQVDVVSDANGVATLPAGMVWRLGASPEANTLEASGPFVHDALVFTADARGPDLTVESISVAPETRTALTPLTFSVIVRNVGASSSSEANVSIAATAGGTAVNFPVPLLEPNETAEITWTPVLVPAGTHSATATVLPSEVPADPVGNDSRSIEYDVLVPPDLTVVSFTRSPATPTTTDAVTYTIQIDNLGGSASPATVAQFGTGWSSPPGDEVSSSVGVEEIPIGPIPAGGSLVLELPQGTLRRGTNSASISVDFGNAVPESNESNNSLSLPGFFVDFPTALTTLSGRVLDFATGAALGGAVVSIEELDRSTTTTVDGQYQIANVPAGSYTVTASFIGYEPSSASVTIGSSAVGASFQLRQSAPLLQVMGSTGIGIIQGGILAHGFTIVNGGGGTLSGLDIGSVRQCFDVSCTESGVSPWVIASLSTATNTITLGNSIPTSEIAPGTYNFFIDVFSNASNNPHRHRFTISITAIVSPPDGDGGILVPPGDDE